MGFIDRLSGLFGRSDTESTETPDGTGAAETTAGTTSAAQPDAADAGEPASKPDIEQRDDTKSASNGTTLEQADGEREHDGSEAGTDDEESDADAVTIDADAGTTNTGTTNTGKTDTAAVDEVRREVTREERSERAQSRRDRAAVFGDQAVAFVEDHPDRELDYSASSLTVLDDVAEQETAEQETVLALGSYFGETLLREAEGTWTKPDGGTWAVVLDGSETDVTLNVFQLASETVDGPTSFEATYRAVEHRL